MFSTKPKPTADQLDEARNMLAGLEELFKAGRENTHASVIHEVLASGEATLEAWLTSRSFWGAKGSMIDRAFEVPRGLDPQMDKHNREEFRKLIVKLGQHQLTSGIFTENMKPHIKRWTEIFEGSSRSNAV